MAKKVSISICKGRGSINHNNRVFVTQNVNKDKIKDNIVYKAEPLEQAYEKCFGEELERYNSDKKPCRQINDYLEHIKNSKNGEKPFYETVVQVGNKQDMKDVRTREDAIDTLNDYAKNFESRNPNLYVFNMVMHLDEASPHLHIDYIPLAHGYKNGLQVRNSLDKALKEQGISGSASRKDNSTIHWQDREKKVLEETMRMHGLERAEEQGLKRDHMTVNQYKAVCEVVKNEVKALAKPLETAPMMFNDKRVSIAKKDLIQLDRRARLCDVHEGTSKRLREEMEEKVRQADMKMAAAELTFQRAEQELDKALDYKKQYAELYDFQSDLNKEYQQLVKVCENQQVTINRLQNENRSLREYVAELKDTFNQKLDDATRPLREKICELEESLSKTCRNLANTMKAVNMFRYDEKGGYKVPNLTKKQNRLIDALDNYVKKALVREHRDSLVSNEVGLSKEISKEVRVLEPKQRGFDLEL